MVLSRSVVLDWEKIKIMIIMKVTVLTITLFVLKLNC